MKQLKPLLATKADFEKIKFPVLATPKLDGIRCLVVNHQVMSRNMKLIPNDYIRDKIKDLPNFDGELMIKGDFNAVSSAVMSKEGEPQFTYYVFDEWDRNISYEEMIENWEWEYGNFFFPPRNVQLLFPVMIHNEEQLLALLDKYISEGYEGVMIRDPKGKYKFGRSTVNEGILLKIKRFYDDEAILIDMIEKMTNTNELEEDELGYAKRSSAKAGLVPAGTVGSCLLEWKGLTFKVGFGPGFTDVIKQEMWDNRKALIGKTYKFSYQELSKDGIPRFGKLLGERHKDDL